MKLRIILGAIALTFAASSIASAMPHKTDIVKCGGDEDEKKKDQS